MATLTSARATGRQNTTQPRQAEGGPRVPRRRRRWLGLAAALLVAAAATGNVLLIRSVVERVEVLVLARDVPQYAMLAGADLATVEVPVGVRASVVLASERATVVGRRAAVGLSAGAVLAPEQLTDHVVPGAGERLIGLLVKPGQLPARGVRPGDLVEVAVVGGASPPATSSSSESSSANPGSAAEDMGGVGFRARVVQVSAPDANGAVTVDIVVAAGTTSAATAAAVAEHVVIVVLGPDE